jgi:hypothetical protein
MITTYDRVYLFMCTLYNYTLYIIDHFQVACGAGAGAVVVVAGGTCADVAS